MGTEELQQAGPPPGEQETFDRVAREAGDAFERAGFHGMVLVGFKHRGGDQWGRWAVVASTYKLDNDLRSELVYSAVKGLMELPANADHEETP